MKGVYSSINNSRETARQSSQLLCLELLLEFIGHMYERACGVCPSVRNLVSLADMNVV